MKAIPKAVGVLGATRAEAAPSSPKVARSLAAPMSRSGYYRHKEPEMDLKMGEEHFSLTEAIIFVKWEPERANKPTSQRPLQVSGRTGQREECFSHDFSKTRDFMLIDDIYKYK